MSIGRVVLCVKCLFKKGDIGTACVRERERIGKCGRVRVKEFSRKRYRERPELRLDVRKRESSAL